VALGEVVTLNVKYLAAGMVFIFIGVAGLLYFHGMVIVQPDRGIVEAGSAKSLTLLGLYTGMGCLLVGAIGGSLIGHSFSQKTWVSEEGLVTASLGIKYCRYCGTENKKNAHFCEKCGKKILSE